MWAPRWSGVWFGGWLGPSSALPPGALPDTPSYTVPAEWREWEVSGELRVWLVEPEWRELDVAAELRELTAEACLSAASRAYVAWSFAPETPERTVVVEPEDRTIEVLGEVRELGVGEELREFEVPAEDRTATPEL